MTTSSKTNMNEDLKEKFKEKFYSMVWRGTITDEDVDGLWFGVETAITKAREEGYKAGLNDLKQIWDAEKHDPKSKQDWIEAVREEERKKIQDLGQLELTSNFDEMMLRQLKAYGRIMEYLDQDE